LAVVNGDTQTAQQRSVGQPLPRRDSRPAWSLRAASNVRPALAGLLLLAAIAGISATSPGSGTGGPWRGHPLAIDVTLEIALALVLLALTVLTRRSPQPGHLRTRLRYLVRWATIVMMITVVVVGIVNLIGTRHGSTVLNLLHGNIRPARVKPRPLPRGVSGPNLTYLLYALIAVLLIAAIVVCVLVVARLRPAQPGLDAIGLDDDGDGASLRRAVESGRAALVTLGEARAAIIACYLAMEDSLASAGTIRTAAETPDELLARATATGLLHGSAAARLTSLFYEARFSTHALPPAAKTSATAALDEISAELAGALQ
jgi:hypothetical protein